MTVRLLKARRITWAEARALRAKPCRTMRQIAPHVYEYPPPAPVEQPFTVTWIDEQTPITQADYDRVNRAMTDSVNRAIEDLMFGRKKP